jgi:hypothetical protein
MIINFRILKILSKYIYIDRNTHDQKKKIRRLHAHNSYRFIQQDEEAWTVYILTLGLFSLECPTIQVVKKTLQRCVV